MRTGSGLATGASMTFPSRRVSITFTDGTTRRRLSDSRSITRDATDAGCSRACDGAATATPRSAHSAADITTVIAIAYRVRVEVIWIPLRVEPSTPYRQAVQHCDGKI